VNDHLQQPLLLLARQSIQMHLAGEPLPDLPLLDVSPDDFGGAFVTLHNRGRLRGCIGRFDCADGLVQTVQKMAIAVLTDPRFVRHPVTSSELPELEIEISLLSPMEPTTDPLSLAVGIHGIYIRREQRTGCFLPQVATQMRWDVEELLSRCCSEKAGLPPDAWRDPDTEIYVFTAHVFSDRTLLSRDPNGSA